MSDLISKQAALDAIGEMSDLIYKNIEKGATYPGRDWFDGMACAEDIINRLPAAQPEIIRCKDCKHNPKESWFGCPMSHLSEEQRPETAWCWKGERRTDE